MVNNLMERLMKQKPKPTQMKPLPNNPIGNLIPQPPSVGPGPITEPMGQQAAQLKSQANPYGAAKLSPITSPQPINTMGGASAMRNDANQYGASKFSPIMSPQPISAMGSGAQMTTQPINQMNSNIMNTMVQAYDNNGTMSNASATPQPLGPYTSGTATPQPLGPYTSGTATPQLLSASSVASKTPIPNANAKTGPVSNQPVVSAASTGSSAKLSQGTINEIIRKAKAGIPLDSPTAEKTAIYNQYKPKNVPLSQGTIDEIYRKAMSGMTMDSPTPEKTALYEQFKAQLNPTANTGPTGPNAMQGPTTQPIQNWNSNQSIPDFLGMTPEMIEKIMNGYTNGSQYYDPSQDPVYQSMMQLANKQADAAGISTMEDMNERGILNSTVTSDRVGQIKQGASDAVLGAIPGLAGNFQNQQSNNQAGMQNLLNSIFGAGQFQQTFAEGNRQFDKNFSLDEAATTGRYMSPENTVQINRLLELKQINESSNVPSQVKAKNAAEADEIRRNLSASGVDVSGLAGNINYANAMQSVSNMGRNTLAQQDRDLAKTQVMGKETSVQAQGLIQTILKAKQGNESKSTTAAQKAANNAAANNARNQLAALGFDVSKLGSNVTYAQAVKNANNLGGSTLGAKAQEADQAFREKQQSFTESSFDREMNYKEQLAMIEADLKSRGLDIDEVKNSIDLFSAQSDADYKIHQKSLGISDKDAEVNTNKAITEALKSKSTAEALAYITKNGSTLARQGVNVSKVLQSLVYKFPEINKVINDDDEDSFFP